MPSLKELNDKIASLGNTRKMTRTMKLVAASKLRRAQQNQEEASEYAQGLRHAIMALAASGVAAGHPLLEKRPAKRTLMLVLLSDRGLCGGFNNNLIRLLDRWLDTNSEGLGEISISCCGRRAYTHYKDRLPIVNHYEGVSERPTYDRAHKIGDDLIDHFLADEFDQVFVVFNVFHSVLRQEAVVRKVLPIEEDPAEDVHRPADYLFEPGKDALLNLLLPTSVRFSVFGSLLESSAGEHAARMTAMDSATKNADDLVEDYTLVRNRARQAAITTELTEIVTGAEAL